jgi:outer membrane scaffolding protein for murein synthesis (MipA/OmpV family)
MQPLNTTNRISKLSAIGAILALTVTPSRVHAADNPIVEEKLQPSFMAVIGYKFWD